MIVDTSAVLAILLGEPEQKKFLDTLRESGRSFISPVSFVELAIICSTKGGAVSARIAEQFLQKAGIEIAPISVEQTKIARDAYRDFGKGQHKASLNLGDCFSYALAKEREEPLLYKGKDFSKTDIASVV